MKSKDLEKFTVCEDQKQPRSPKLIVVCVFLDGVILVPALLGEFIWIFEITDDEMEGNDMDNIDQSIAKTRLSFDGDKSLERDGGGRQEIEMIAGDRDNDDFYLCKVPGFFVGQA